MSEEKKIICGFCNDGKRIITVAEPNRDFLIARAEDGKLDLAITYSRIAWETCSNLKKSLDTNSIVEDLMSGLQKMFNEQIRSPIGTITTSLGGLMTTLRALTEQNPKLIQQCSEREIESLKTQIKLLEGTISEPSKQINQMLNMISELVYKPNTKGNVGEKILASLWSEYFEHDDVKLVGNAGNEDLMVTPFLNSGANNFGEKISIERKTGKQTYTGTHFKASTSELLLLLLRMRKAAPICLVGRDERLISSIRLTIPSKSSKGDNRTKTLCIRENHNNT